MEKRDLIPSYENVCFTFCDDSIGRNEELACFINLLNNITGPYSIAIDGQWGSGKTFFVKQAKMLLDVYNPHSQLVEWDIEEHRDKVKRVWTKLAKKHFKEDLEPSLHLAVYFDAWAYNSENDPMLSLLYQIAAVASKDYQLEGTRNNLEVLGNILDLWRGRNYKDLILSLQKTKITDSVKNSMDLRDQINEYFSLLLPEHGDRLIVFVDELDRCVPSFAVRLLERIKHYFTHEKITFVFSLNMEQMQHTVRQHYGDGFDAHKYVERFFDLTIPMPKLKRAALYNQLPYDITNAVFRVADAFVQQHHMEMREITRYYAALHMMTSNESMPGFDTQSCWFCRYFLVPVALGLQKCDITKYYQFINGEDSSPLIDLLSNEIVMDYVIRFFSKIPEEKAAEQLETVYKAIFIDAKAKKSNTILGNNYNENTYNYFLRTTGLLSTTTTTE